MPSEQISMFLHVTKWRIVPSGHKGMPPSFSSAAGNFQDPPQGRRRVRTVPPIQRQNRSDTRYALPSRGIHLRHEGYGVAPAYYAVHSIRTTFVSEYGHVNPRRIMRRPKDIPSGYSFQSIAART